MRSFNVRQFSHPPAMFRPVPFFSWNERMEPQELRRQVDLISKAGWGGVFVHSRVGLTTPYLGREWFRAVDATIDQCRKRRLKVWLYDEDKWPSGYSGGSVPLVDPAFRQQAVIARPAGQTPPPDCEPIGEAQGGLQPYVWTAPLGHDWFNGTCYTGLMHREAMKKFLEEAYESYFKRYKNEYGGIIVGEFTDEPCSIFRNRLPHGAVPFTPELLGRFEKRWGYDPRAHLHHLFQDGGDAPRFRIHYFRIINDLFEENFTRQLSDWCEGHSIALTGHYMLEDSLYGQQAWGVKIMPNYRHMRFPGIDHLGRHVGNLITLKQCQSVVNQYARPRMLSELYGVAGGSLSFEDRHWIAAQQMCLGVNLLNPHLSLYTMTGCRKRDYPQNIFYQQPWWPLNAVLDLPLSRVCGALAQGKYRAEALVIHPGESSFVHWETELDPARFDGLMGWNHEPATPRAKQRIDAIDTDVKRVIEILLGDQRTFDLGDETILGEVGEVVVEEGRPLLRVNKMSYPVVVLPTMATIAATTVALLESFIAAGGSVIRCGGKAKWIDGEPSRRLAGFYGKVDEVDFAGLARKMRRLVSPEVEVPGLSARRKEKLFVHIRDLPDGDRLVYLVNLSRFLDFPARVRFRGEFETAILLDTATGEERKLATTANSGLEVELPFHRTEAHLLRLRRQKERGRGISLVEPSPEERVTLRPADWKVRRLDENALTLDFAYWRLGDGAWSSGATPVLGIQQYLNSCRYDGPLTLRFPVRVSDPAAVRDLRLVIEYPERYRISVNGRRVKYAGLPAWRDFRWMPIDISGLLREGENVIEVDCDCFRHGDPTSIHDYFRRYGTEIESLYLVGDFSVKGRSLADKPVAAHWSKFGLPPIAVLTFAAESFSLGAPVQLKSGDTTVQGLPFYAGRLEYRILLPKLGRRGRWFLRLGELDCPIAEVAVGGAPAGYIYRHPLELEVTEPLRAATGDHRELRITLYGTLRNLLGPHHHREGELAEVGPNSFSPDPALSENGENRWIFEREAARDLPAWSDRYCMVSFGRLGRVELLRRP
jgi:hypothetical protein